MDFLHGGIGEWFYGFRNRLALVLGCLSLLISTGAIFYFDRAASDEMQQDRGRALQSVARSVAYSLAENLRERDREISEIARSPIFITNELSGADVRLRMEHAKRSYRYYAWLGVADRAGIVQSATDHALEGENVSRRPWFPRARLGPYIGEVREAALPANISRKAEGKPAVRFLDFASPVLDEVGELRGVVGCYVYWSWAEDIIRAALDHHTDATGVEAFVVSREGTVLSTSDAYDDVRLPVLPPERRPYAVLNWGRNGEFLTSAAPVISTTSTDLQWRIVVRQPVSRAFSAIERLHGTLFLLWLFSSGGIMLLAYFAATRISRPIERLADAASRFERGDDVIGLPGGKAPREIARLTDSLRRITESPSHDPVTGLYNRTAAAERLLEEFSRMKRTEVVYTVLFIEVNHLEAVRDTFGADRRDRVLRDVAQVIQTSRRAIDFAARYGEDRLIVVLPHTKEDGVMIVIDKIRGSTARCSFPFVGGVTLSVGFSVADLEDPDEEEVLNRAEEVLVRAKANIRGTP